MLSAQNGATVSAMPVVSYAALSERPPLVGVSCAKDSFTLKVAFQSKSFSLCLLGKEHVDAFTRLASAKGSRDADKLAEAGLRHRNGRKLDVPVIIGSAAAIECSLIKSLTLGDHVFLVGKIERASASPDFRGYWRFASYHPMLYAGWREGMNLYRNPSRRTR